MLKRRRIKQTEPLIDRLTTYAAELRAKAALLSDEEQKSILLQRARGAEAAIAMQGWLKSSGLQPPT